MARINIRHLAEAKGLNITTLAEAAGIAYTTAHKLWHGQTLRVDLENLAAVARVLGVRTGDLIEDDPLPLPKTAALAVGPT